MDWTLCFRAIDLYELAGKLSVVLSKCYVIEKIVQIFPGSITFFIG